MSRLLEFVLTRDESGYFVGTPYARPAQCHLSLGIYCLFCARGLSIFAIYTAARGWLEKTVKLDLEILFDPESMVAIVSNGSKCTLKYCMNETGLHVELYESGELIDKVDMYNEDITVEDVLNALKNKSLRATYARSQERG